MVGRVFKTFFSLESLSFLYLGLSFSIYFVTILNWELTLIVFLLQLLGLIFFYKNLYKENYPAILNYFKSPQAIVALALVALWIWASGQGAFTGQSIDHLKHNAMINSLMNYDWPVFHPYAHDPEKGFYLVYYLGHYIYPALVGKITHEWFDAVNSQYFFVLFSFVLILGWIGRIFQRLPWWVSLVLFLFAGMDVIGFYFRHGHFAKWAIHLEWWAHPWQFSGNHSLLFWVPQHLIAGWLPSVILYTYYREKRDFKFALIWPCLSFWWSAFTPIGLIPFFIFSFLELKTDSLSGMGAKVKSLMSIENLTWGLLPALLCLGFFDSLLMDVPNHIIPGNEIPWAEFWPRALTMWSGEIGLFVLAIALSSLYLGRKTLLLVAVFSLSAFLCLFYRMGTWNDFCMRASIGPLFLLQIMVMEIFKNSYPWSYSRALPARILALIALVAGGISTANEFQYSFSPHRPGIILTWDALNFDPQYLGAPSAFFNQHLLKSTRGLAREIDQGKANEFRERIKERWQADLSFPDLSTPLNSFRLPASAEEKQNIIRAYK